jgi:hypothetical protein
VETLVTGFQPVTPWQNRRWLSYRSPVSSRRMTLGSELAIIDAGHLAPRKNLATGLRDVVYLSKVRSALAIHWAG